MAHASPHTRCAALQSAAAALAVSLSLALAGNGADAAIAAQPDLFLCAFGMNDASGKMQPEPFANTLRALVDKVRAARPDCDAIIISSMTANPEWIHATPNLYPAYAAAIEKLAGPGIAAANVTAVWTALLERKQVLDLTGNGLNHPNDFGHRIYADVILGVISGP